MTTELVWSTVKPTFEEVRGKEIKFIWRLKSTNELTEDTCRIDSMGIYNLAFDEQFICYADLTAPVSPLPLWGTNPRIRKTLLEDYFWVWTNEVRSFSKRGFEDEQAAVIDWNRIAEALNEVEK